MASAINEYGLHMTPAVVHREGPQGTRHREPKPDAGGVYFGIGMFRSCRRRPSSSGVQALLDRNEEVRARSMPKQVALQGWELVVLFVQGARMAGANLTQANVIKEDNTLTAFAGPQHGQLQSALQRPCTPLLRRLHQGVREEDVVTLNKARNVFNCFNSINPKSNPVFPLPARFSRRQAEPRGAIEKESCAPGESPRWRGVEGREPRGVGLRDLLLRLPPRRKNWGREVREDDPRLQAHIAVRSPLWVEDGSHHPTTVGGVSGDESYELPQWADENEAVRPATLRTQAFHIRPPVARIRVPFPFRDTISPPLAGSDSARHIPHILLQTEQPSQIAASCSEIVGCLRKEVADALAPTGCRVPPTEYAHSTSVWAAAEGSTLESAWLRGSQTPTASTALRGPHHGNCSPR